MKWLENQQVQAVWRRLREALLNPERIRQALTRNLALKLLSLGIAFGLWSFVNFGERDTETTIKVPLEMRNIPGHLMITSPRMDFVDLRVTGPKTLLGRIDRNRVSIGLDLNGVRPGPAVFRLGAESLNLPRGVRVVRLNPAQVTIELERVSRKTVPVRLRLLGKPLPDLQVVDTKVSPETVQVSGPASDIDDVHAANTEPVDISKAPAGTLERELPLEAAGEYVSFSASRVAAQVRIGEVSVTREIKGVLLRVRNAAHDAHLVPEAIRMVVKGPRRLVGDLELPDGAAYVDADGVGVGERMLKPSITLPEGVELVSVEPATVKLTLSATKRPRRPAR